MLRSIQWRIALSFTLIVVVVMTILGVFLTDKVRDIQMDNMRRTLKTQALIIGEMVLPLLPDTTEGINLESFIDKIGKPVDERITVIDSSGNVIGDSEEDTAVMENHVSRPEFRDALSGEYGESTRYSTTLGYDMMYVAMPVISEGEIIGAVRVSLPLDDIERMTGNVVTSVVIAIAAAVVLVVVFAWLLSRLITKPVRELTEASARMASGDLNQKISVGSLNETNRLARSFNKMSARLSEKMEAVSLERARLAGILDNIADGVIMTDKEGKVLTTNRAAISIFRLKNGNISEVPLIEIIHDHELSEVVQKCISTGVEQINQFESEHYKRYLRILAVPVKENRLVGVLLLIQDLTELRSLQTMRRELIGNISHDFRTPLAGIKAMVETLQDGAIDEKKDALDFLSRIVGEVDRLTQLVTELTELSRIETGKGELKKEKLDINSLVQDAVNQIQPVAERAGIGIEFTKDDTLPEPEVDGERIKQVVTNLLHNAVKFSSRGEKITIVTRHEINMVQVDVIDNGIGIAAKDLPHIFERFYMVDKARSGGGTGLGLAIARHVIEAHNGSINVKSIEGKGSVFTFSLPVV